MKRNSVIELLKVIGIIFIVFSHIDPINSLGLASSIDMNIVPTSFDATYAFLIFKRHFGSIGNYLFVIPTCYYLLQTSKIKWSKIIRLVVDTTLVAMTFAIIYIISGQELSVYQYIFNLTPLAIFDKWFIYSYLAVYILHPLFNYLINKMNKNIHLIICLFFILLMLGFYLIKFNVDVTITQMFGMFFCYFFIGYQTKYDRFLIIKKDNLALNIIRLIISFSLIAIYSLSSIWLSNNVSFLYGNMYSLGQIYNPLCFLVSLSLFNLFMLIKPLNNKVINTLSSLSFIAYIVHENSLFKAFTRPYIFEYCYQSFGFYNPIGFIIILSIFTIIIALGISYLYSISIGKLLDKIIVKR